MIRPPLPLAPRPHAGEAISSWVGRVAARYDITGEDLTRFIVGPRGDRNSVSDLDHRADLVLEEALGSAARMETATIGKLRVVRGDGSASCWHRGVPAWCPVCVEHDLARAGEVHGRAVWRLGCGVLCPVHDGQLLDHLCRRCMADAGCRYRPVDGRLLLACKACERPVPATDKDDWRANRGEGAFGIALTTRLIRLIQRLQRDLIAGLAERSPACAWGPVRSSATLMTITSDLTIAVIQSADLRVAPLLDFAAITRGQPGAMAFQPITLAVLTPYAAFGLMALIAIFLEGVLLRNPARHHWRPDGFPRPLDATTFLAWLSERERSMLHDAAARWGSRAGEAARRAIEAVPVHRRPGRRSPTPDVRGDLC